MRKTLALFILAVSLVISAGCGSGCLAGKGQLNPTTGVYDSNAPAASIVVTAENFREIAANSFDAIMTIERQNEAALKALNPEIHKFAERVRKESKGWLDDLTTAKKAYQSARTPENADKLKSVSALIDSMLLITSQHLAQAATVKAP